MTGKKRKVKMGGRMKNERQKMHARKGRSDGIYVTRRKERA